MEPKLKAPRVACPDKERLVALARPQPTPSWRVWASWGSVAAAVGGVLALLTPTAEVPQKVSLALTVPQVVLSTQDTAKKAVFIEKIKPVPKAVSAPKSPQVPQEVRSTKTETTERVEWTIELPQRPTLRLAYDKPRPAAVAPVEAQEQEPEPTLLDRLLEPLRSVERPEPKKLFASFKPQPEDERY